MATCKFFLLVIHIAYGPIICDRETIPLKDPFIYIFLSFSPTLSYSKIISSV